MAYQEAERTFSDILLSAVDNIRSIIRSEIRLAKTETKEEAAKAISAAKILAAGVVFALYAGAFLLLSLMRGIEGVTPPWAAALIVAGAVGLAAALAIRSGLSRLKGVDVKPEKTVETIKENVEWVKDQTR
jgi:hypothetical protein